MQYGYCGDPSINWKLEYSSGNVGLGAYGKLNVMLIRSLTYTTPLWYTAGGNTHLKAWYLALKCDDTHIPRAGSLGVVLVEQYRWRPKNANPGEGQVINYNSPCLKSQSRRKGNRLHLSCNVQGTGALSEDVFMNATTHAEQHIEEVAGFVISGSWLHNSCAIERPISEWHSYNTSGRLITGVPSVLPDWSQIQISINSMDNIYNSTMTVTEVQYFPDRHSSEINASKIKEILATTAGVLNCPA